VVSICFWISTGVRHYYRSNPFINDYSLLYFICKTVAILSVSSVTLNGFFMKSSAPDF